MKNGPGTGLLGEFAKAASQAPAIYFAPIFGAWAGVSGQWRKTHTSRPLSHHKTA